MKPVDTACYSDKMTVCGTWDADYNFYGPLGNGSYVNRNLFVRVITAASSGVVAAIATGGFHSMVLRKGRR